MNCRFVFAAALLLLPALSVRALDDVPDDDETPAPAPAPAEPAPPAPVPEPPIPPSEPAEVAPVVEAPAAAEAPSERPASGIWKGRHRLQLVAGYQFGNTVRDAGILSAPITGQPGDRDYPAASPLQVELADSPIFGLRYAYFAGDDWGIELALEHVQSEITDPDSNIDATVAELLDPANIFAPSMLRRQLLADRLRAHSAPHDMSVTYFDIGALHVFNPRKRWPIEIGAGLGWAFPSMDGPVAYERFVATEVIETEPFDPRTIANDIVEPPPPFGQCLADNDPCIELEEQGGLTWHAFMGIGYAVKPNVHLHFGGKLRYVEQLVDPGDSNVTTELTLGVGFLFGGR